MLAVIKLRRDYIMLSIKPVEANVDSVIKLKRDYISCSIKPMEANVDCHNV